MEAKSAKAFTKNHFEAVPDTGSDENAMDWETFQALGVDLVRGQKTRKEFVLANGKTVKSMGWVEVVCCFARENLNTKYKVRFNVFSRLAAPIILGKDFLDQTQTLTRHTHRLKQKEAPRDGVLRVMHCNHASRRIRCSVDGISTFANADTGAEINLVSPAFMARMNGRHPSLRKEDLLIQLADGTIERITASFEGNLSLAGGQGDTNVEAKFYVLPGLTSDVLIGEDSLYEADVFQKHLDAFVDIPGDDDQLSLNIIKLLTQTESWLLEKLRGSASQAPQRGTSSPTALLDFTLSPNSFRSVLAEADARELHRREQAESTITRLSGHERIAACSTEQSRVRTYDSERARCVALHQRRLSAHRTKRPGS